MPGARLDRAYDVFSCGGVNNYTGYCSGPVHRDLVQTVRILDPEQRARGPEPGRRQAGEGRARPAALPARGGLIAYRASIRGVVPNEAEGFTWNSEDWWLSR